MRDHNLTAEELNAMNAYATQDEIDWLRALAPTLPAGARVVMIGAGPGVLMLALLEGARAGLAVTVIDIQSCEWTQAHIAWATERQPSRVPAVYRDCIRYITADSYAVGRAWAGGPVDLLIVDGDHMAPGVTRDMDAWLGHVAPGGIVLFHDYDFAGTVFEEEARTTDKHPTEVRGPVDARMVRPEWERLGRVGCSCVWRRVLGGTG